MSALASHEVLDAWIDAFSIHSRAFVEATLMHQRSASTWRVLARAAGLDASAESPIDAVRAAPDDVDEAWLASFARVVGTQALGEHDEQAARLAFELLVRRGSDAMTPRYLAVFAECALLGGDARTASDVVERLEEDGWARRFLELDLANPRSSALGDPDTWQARWAAAFDSRGLAAPLVDMDAPTLFDGLGARAERPVSSGPLVSVVMTTFQPGPEAVVAATSILEQSWTNLELIVVDDASGPQFDETLDSLAGLDSRVRVVRMPVNGGTYLARNAGIAAARGPLIAGQDSDDWSHPLRLERQAAPLLADPDVTASRCAAWTVSPDLVFHRRGYWPERRCEGSLMVRTEAARSLGGYVRSRRGADSEFVARLTATGGTVVDVADPLWLTRIQPGTLSRSDFFPAWHHPARGAFRASFERWHAQVKAGAASAHADAAGVHIPDRFAVSAAERPPLDVLLVTDLRFDTPSLRMWLDVAAAGAARGMRVGVCQLDDPLLTTSAVAAPCPRVVKADNLGTAELVTVGDEREVDLVVVTSPSLVQLMPEVPMVGIRAARVVAVAPPREGPTGPLFDPGLCDAAISRGFGVVPTWLPVSGQARTDVVGMVTALSPDELPVAIDETPWAAPWRVRPRSRTQEVVGFVAATPFDYARWDDDVAPRSKAADLRSFVNYRWSVPKKASEALVLTDQDLPFESFLRQIDRLQVFSTDAVAYARLTLEAEAAGVAIIELEPSAETLRRASPDEVLDTLLAAREPA